VTRPELSAAARRRATIITAAVAGATVAYVTAALHAGSRRRCNSKFDTRLDRRRLRHIWYG
jgi:hypothetical protein